MDEIIPPSNDVQEHLESELDNSLQRVSARRLNRIVAVQFIYTLSSQQYDDLKIAVTEFLDSEFTKETFKANEITRDKLKFAEFLIHGTMNNLQQIDSIIKDCSKNWAFNRIAACDLAILRVAIFELIYNKEIAPISAINEALEISKFISTNDSTSFINGILNRILPSISRPSREAK